jgi:hypothetical protein
MRIKILMSDFGNLRERFMKFFSFLSGNSIFLQRPVSAWAELFLLPVGAEKVTFGKRLAGPRGAIGAA